jgi:hypothetical protein
VHIQARPQLTVVHRLDLLVIAFPILLWRGPQTDVVSLLLRSLRLVPWLDRFHRMTKGNVLTWTEYPFFRQLTATHVREYWEDPARYPVLTQKAAKLNLSLPSWCLQHTNV